ncbi:hypothetical protein GGS20DRAFT_593589 [Poronia punctata]|nr:hypothetical protein GGS20DRAFT_593589 [Poronia punctata]
MSVSGPVNDSTMSVSGPANNWAMPVFGSVNNWAYPKPTRRFRGVSCHSHSRLTEGTAANLPLLPPPSLDTYRTRAFHCRQCNKKFKTAEGLEQHKESDRHNESGSFECKCGRVFEWYSAQLHHRESGGCPVGDRSGLLADGQKCVCPCGREFGALSALWHHWEGKTCPVVRTPSPGSSPCYSVVSVQGSQTTESPSAEPGSLSPWSSSPSPSPEPEPKPEPEPETESEPMSESPGGPTDTDTRSHDPGGQDLQDHMASHTHEEPAIVVQGDSSRYDEDWPPLPRGPTDTDTRTHDPGGQDLQDHMASDTHEEPAIVVQGDPSRYDDDWPPLPTCQKPRNVNP